MSVCSRLTPFRGAQPAVAVGGLLSAPSRVHLAGEDEETETLLGECFVECRVTAEQKRNAAAGSCGEMDGACGKERAEVGRHLRGGILTAGHQACPRLTTA